MLRTTKHRILHRSAKELVKDYPDHVKDFIIQAFEKENIDLNLFDTAFAIENTLHKTVHIYVGNVENWQNDYRHVCNFGLSFKEDTFMYGTHPYKYR